MENKKMMEEPKAEFVEVKLDDTVVASNGAAWGTCSGGASTEECSGASIANY